MHFYKKRYILVNNTINIANEMLYPYLNTFAKKKTIRFVKKLLGGEQFCYMY
jgi:hypothetical protein